MVIGKVAPLRGAVKSFRRITAGHLLGTVADELWEIAARGLHPAGATDRSGTPVYVETRRAWFGGWYHGVFDATYVFSFSIIE